MASTTPILRVKERITGPRGIYDIDNEWYGYVDEFKYTIGLAGLMGFGVGCCRPELLPDDMAPMPSCYDRWSVNYGNYIHLPSASIMCFLPAHHIDIQSPGNTNAPFFGSKVVITDGQVGDSVLARPFRDGGEDLAGIFIDKYQICNARPDGSGLPNTTSGNPGDVMLTGGIGASRPLQWPCSMAGNSATVSGITALTSKALNASAPNPAGNLGGAFAAAKTRGAAFNAMPIWVTAQLAYLSLAHAQALLDNTGTPIANATDNAAWMDTAPYAPKGNNNNGADVNKTTLQFARADILGTTSVSTGGFAGQLSRAYTGAANISGTPAVEHTTHNGQLSGVVDLNGNQWEAVPGLTNSGGTQGGYKMWMESVSWNFATANSVVNSAGTGLIADVSDNGIWWTDANAFTYLVANSGGTFHPNTSWAGEPTRKMMTECGLARSAGTNTSQTSTNIFGGDGLFRRHINDLLPIAGGYWFFGASAGVFALFLNPTSPTANDTFGCRAVRLLAA
jgi:hypothetical protein